MRSEILPVRTATLLLTVTVVVAAALAGALVMLVRANAADSDVEHSRRQLRDTAGQVVAQVFSVNRDTWQADRTRARGLVGGRFAANHATELTRPPADGVVRVVWTPDVVGITDVGSERGAAVIRATVRTTPVSGSTIVEKRSVTAQFDRVADRWVLDDLDVLQ